MTSVSHARFYPPGFDADIEQLNVRAVWISARQNPSEVVFSLDGGTAHEHVEFVIARDDAASLATLIRNALGGEESSEPRVELLRAHLQRSDELPREGICADHVTADPDVVPGQITIGLSTSQRDAWWAPGYGMEWDVSRDGAGEIIAQLEELARLPWRGS